MAMRDANGFGIRLTPDYAYRMPRYRVSFDGKRQETFDTLDEATTWAQEVSETGRMVWVTEKRRLRGARLCAVFPDERAEEATAIYEEAERFARLTSGVGGS